MAGVITASEPSWIAPFTGLSPRCFGKLVTVVRREIGNESRRGRPWRLPLEDLILLVTAYWRTNLTLRQLAPLFGIVPPVVRIERRSAPASCPNSWRSAGRLTAGVRGVVSSGS